MMLLLHADRENISKCLSTHKVKLSIKLNFVIFFKFSPGNKKNYLSKKAYPNNVTSHYDDYLDVVSKVNVNVGRVGGYLVNPEVHVSHQKEFFHSIIEK